LLKVCLKRIEWTDKVLTKISNLNNAEKLPTSDIKLITSNQTSNRAFFVCTCDITFYNQISEKISIDSEY
jgi:hypothetical protein